MLLDPSHMLRNQTELAGNFGEAREFLKSRDNYSAHVSVLSALSRWKFKCRKRPLSQVENPLYELLTYDY